MAGCCRIRAVLRQSFSLAERLTGDFRVRKRSQKARQIALFRTQDDRNGLGSCGPTVFPSSSGEPVRPIVRPVPPVAASEPRRYTVGPVDVAVRCGFFGFDIAELRLLRFFLLFEEGTKEPIERFSEISADASVVIDVELLEGGLVELLA